MRLIQPLLWFALFFLGFRINQFWIIILIIYIHIIYIWKHQINFRQKNLRRIIECLQCSSSRRLTKTSYFIFCRTKRSTLLRYLTATMTHIWWPRSI
jgi:predicted membrane protein